MANAVAEYAAVGGVKLAVHLAMPLLILTSSIQPLKAEPPVL